MEASERPREIFRGVELGVAELGVAELDCSGELDMTATGSFYSAAGPRALSWSGEVAENRMSERRDDRWKHYYANK